jgi:hypothetical protein
MGQGESTCTAPPRSVVRPRPLEQLEMPPRRRMLADAGVPLAPARSRVLQALQVVVHRRVARRRSGPRTPVS